MTRRARIAVPGDPSAVAFARDRVITRLQAWGVRLGGEKRDAIKLVTSELITNAVLHDGNPEPPGRRSATENEFVVPVTARSAHGGILRERMWAAAPRTVARAMPEPFAPELFAPELFAPELFAPEPCAPGPSPLVPAL
jgi:hypothetical protein